MKNKVLYFAYGSNMNQAQMVERCNSAKYIGNALLKDYELCFPIISKKRDNMGVASIRGKENSNVEGVLYELTSEDLLILDKFESRGKNYERCEIEVFKDNSEKIKAWTYIAIDNDSSYRVPSKKYLDIIIAGAEEHNLSKEYIEFLKEFQHTQY